MSREVHVRLCERLEVKSLWPTHPGSLRDTAVDVTLRLDNAVVLPTYPQPPQQQPRVA